MATYTIVSTRPLGRQSANWADFPDDATIIADGGVALGDDVIALAIGRGWPVCETDWLGLWEWNGGQPMWTPDE